MKKLTISKKLLALAGFLAFGIVGLIANSPAYASSGYIQISPTTEDIELEPGKTYSGTVRVMNIGDETWCKVIEIDEKGRINLSRKQALKEMAEKAE